MLNNCCLLENSGGIGKGKERPDEENTKRSIRALRIEHLLPPLGSGFTF